MNYRRNLVCLLMVVSLLGVGQVWGAAGDPLWEQTINYLPDYDNTYADACAATASTLIVCGDASKTTTLTEPPYTSSTISRGFIRAYDAATGALKWQGAPLTLAATSGAFNINRFDKITLSGNIAMIQGLSYNDQGNYAISKTIVRAYNADTGQLLWENVEDGFWEQPGTEQSFTAANRLYMIGADAPWMSHPHFFSAWVRAYQIPSTGPQALGLLLQ